jgi:signal-transduction protein with cAMP-binding, CBS, and nucleotidyltransferase domain
VVSEPAEPVSILTERDLAQALADDVDPDTPVAAAASPHPVTVPIDASAVEAATRMLHHDIRHLVVTRDGRAVGVVSVRDLLRALVQSHTPQVVYAFVRQATFDVEVPAPAPGERTFGPVGPGAAPSSVTS